MGNSNNEVGYQSSNVSDKDNELYYAFVDCKVQEKFERNDPIKEID